ncbi:MAG TPA: 2'-5' RNA ligase family protein [Acidimicrobiales bacterium]|nr:2'-5' RNA ligase family protein [Acidimicrobiales bacterium]
MSVGTSSGRRQSAIIIPVPAAEAVVERFRLEYDPVAVAGVPAHITLIVPWLPPDEIRPEDVAELADVLGSTAAFEFSLNRVRWFGRAVLWLAPDPVEPFVKLTGMLADRFGTPPYDDEFDEVVPHLTIAHASDGVELASVATKAAVALPIPARAEEVWVMCGDGMVWTIRQCIRLQ